MSYKAWFQCINGCSGQFSLFEVIYQCPSCGDLLEVRHDMDALKTKAPADWIKLFDERCRQNLYPFGSGVWAKKEWVIPSIDNENIVYIKICPAGNTHETSSGEVKGVEYRDDNCDSRINH